MTHFSIDSFLIDVWVKIKEPLKKKQNSVCKYDMLKWVGLMVNEITELVNQT